MLKTILKTIYIQSRFFPYLFFVTSHTNAFMRSGSYLESFRTNSTARGEKSQANMKSLVSISNSGNVKLPTQIYIGIIFISVYWNAEDADIKMRTIWIWRTFRWLLHSTNRTWQVLTAVSYDLVLFQFDQDPPVETPRYLPHSSIPFQIANIYW